MTDPTDQPPLHAPGADGSTPEFRSDRTEDPKQGPPDQHPDDGARKADQDAKPEDAQEVSSRAGGAGDQVHQVLSQAGNAHNSSDLRLEANAKLNVGLQFQDAMNAQGAMFVAGNVQLPAQASDIRPGELPTHVLESIVHGFVATPGFTALVAQVAGRRSLILRAPKGRGRTAAAIRLLLGQGMARVLVLRSDTDIGQQARQIEPDVGYLLCDPVDAAGLNGHTLNDLTSKMEQHGSLLVVTVVNGTHLRDETLLDSAVVLTEWPSHDAVVRQHLEWRLGDRRDAVLAVPQVRQLLAALDPDSPLRHAAELARLIASNTDGTACVDLDRIRTQLAQRDNEEFGIWFASLPDLQHRCYAIAQAVLNGLPYEDIVAAADALHHRLSPPVPVAILGATGSAQLPIVTPRDHFRHSRQELAGILRAKVEESPLRGEHGVAITQTMEYRDEGYPVRTIMHAWAEYDIQRDMLLWLADLVTHPSEPIRIWSATALGILCRRSFEYIAQTVLRPWAASPEPRRRDAAALALHVPAAEDDLRPLVRQMVRGWFDNGDTPLTQATSARAYGYSLGAADPDLALATLHQLATVDDIRVAISVGVSLAELFIENDARLAEPVLATIVQWLADSDREGTAHLSLLIMAAGTETYVRQPDGSTVTWPTLLYDALYRENLRWGLTEAWYHVLTRSNFFAGEAEHVLRSWARSVDTDPNGCTALGMLARAMSENDPYLRGHLHVEAESWVDLDTFGKAPNAAAAVMAALTREV